MRSCRPSNWCFSSPMAPRFLLGPGGVALCLVLGGGCGSTPIGMGGGGGAAGEGGAASQGGRDGSLFECDGGPPMDLVCGADRCGNSLAPECPSGRWVCPVIQLTSSCVPDGDGVPFGVACGSGACPSGMVCELQIGTYTWACTPFPSSCAGDAGWSDTCDCLTQEAVQQNVCRGPGLYCGAPDGGFVLGCTATGNN